MVLLDLLNMSEVFECWVDNVLRLQEAFDLPEAIETISSVHWLVIFEVMSSF